MYIRETIDALRRLKVETGSMACLGCKYESRCSVHGCAIMHNAAEMLERYAAALSQALCERNNFRGAYLEIADMLASLHRGRLPPIPAECPSDAMAAKINEPME